MTAYYNEIDPFCAQWLRNLIAAGHIAPGDVDTRSILDVRPADLAGYTQCHFFAGVGVWSYALRIAGWPDGRRVWTGSCPCQPFSAAGKGGGFDDERHVWPAWHHLIRIARPEKVFGEQVASKDGLAWLDLVQSDLEGEGYAFWPVDLGAAGIGAPHIRQRLWFVADAERSGRESQSNKQSAELLGTAHGSGRLFEPCKHGSGFDGLADSGSTRLAVVSVAHDRRGVIRLQGSSAAESFVSSLLADAAGGQLSKSLGRPEERNGFGPDRENLVGSTGRPGPVNGIWGNADWLLCRDGKWRPVEPGTQPLAYGAPSRVGRLRAYGNAIVAQAAAEVIGAYLEHEQDRGRLPTDSWRLTDDLAEILG